jgi:glutamate dehydrogenase/leucine dehydrogenase
VRVVIEGVGAVGGPCALYLARAGAVVVGIADREKTLLAPDGLDAARVESLLRRREEKCLPRDTPGCRYAEALALSQVEAEVFVSAACSESLDEAALDRLARQGVRTIACGANQTFREAKLGATRVQRLADQSFTVIPDVVANCGMARAFSYLMQHPAAPDTGSLFRAVDRTITEAVREITERSGQRPTGLLAATLGYALDRVDAVPNQPAWNTIA